MSSSSIKVAVRCRPLFGQERPTGGLDIQNRRILLDSKTYDPDYTFPPTATQDDVFQACRPILQCVKEGMNGTIMVYGQTGTGKTYTMLGDCAEGRDGLVHKVVGEVLEYVQQKTLDGGLCALTLSMIEIYNERLTDMLAPEGEEEEVTLISGFPRFTHKVVLSQVDDAIRTIQKGLERRHTAATMMNDRSSRSHVVFIFDLEEHNAFTDQTDVAHLFMIDLAGSESLKKSQATGVAAGEAGKINKSLLALKSVFLALSNTNEATRPGHVPYRDSKLTELLQDSIGGTARTLMIACISSVGRDIEETKSTLLYAVKARSIRNTANTEREKLLVRLRSMEVENQKLRNRLQERVNERGGYFVTKEEHEQLQEVEASYGELKGAVEQLTRDRQCSEARMHIGESQVKVFRAMLEAKSEELQRFKEVYNEALRRFEHHAASLQRMVRGSVGEAKAAVQRSFADNYARLHAWRTELLNALEEPLPTTLTTLPENEETVVLSQHQHVSDALLTQRERESLGASPHERPNTPPTNTQQLQVPEPVLRGANPPTPPASPKRNENAAHSHHSIASVSGRLFGPSRSARGSSASTQRISAASGAAAVSASVSPTRRNNRPRAGPHASAASSRRGTPASSGQLPPSPSLAACHQPPLLPAAAQARDEESAEEERPTSPPPVGTPSWSTALAQHDAQCLRIVQRVNQAVVGMLEECIGAFEQYSAQAALVEQRRRSGVQEAFERLRREVDAQIAVVQRAESASARDLGDAREALRGQLHTKLKAHPPVDAAPLQHVMRSACTEVVRHATHAFPHPCTPAPAEAVMDGIAARLQHCQTMFSVNALDPLSSSAIVLNSLLSGTAGSSSASAASLAGSPLQGKPSSGWMGGALMTADAALMPLLPTSSSTTTVAAAGGGISGSVGSGLSGDGAARQAARASLTPTATEETSSRGSSMVRETRSTTVPPAGGSASLQRRSVRGGPSSLRPSTALSVVPVNRGVGRPGESKRGTQGAVAAAVVVGRGKRTRSAASLSQGGDRPSPRTTPPPQRELQ